MSIRFCVAATIICALCFSVTGLARNLELNASFKVINQSLKKHQYTLSMALLTKDRELLSYQLSEGGKAMVNADKLGQPRFEFVVDSIAPFSTQEIKLNWSVGERKISQKLDSKLAKHYRQSGPFIESDILEIISLSKRLGFGDAIEHVENISRWVSKNIRRADYASDVSGAAWALKNRKGDCTEQALLFVALARASGIPARAMGGYIMERSGRVFAKDFHNWAEAYVDGRWIIADPYYGVFDNGYEKYVATQVLDFSSADADNRRFWVDGGEGLKVTMH